MKLQHNSRISESNRVYRAAETINMQYFKRLYSMSGLHVDGFNFLYNIFFLEDLQKGLFILFSLFFFVHRDVIVSKIWMKRKWTSNNVRRRKERSIIFFMLPNVIIMSVWMNACFSMYHVCTRFVNVDRKWNWLCHIVN